MIPRIDPPTAARLFALPILLCLIQLAPVFSVVGEDAKPLEASALDALDAKPEVPKMRARSSKRTEVSREYVDADAKARSGSETGLRARAARVTTFSDGTVEERPLVEVPLLFGKNSAKLEGEQSQANLKLLAEKLRSLSESDGRFTIEGHASAEGSSQRNEALSQERAATVATMLRQLGVPDGILASAIGYGSKFAAHPASAAESALVQDRRVLVVRER